MCCSSLNGDKLAFSYISLNIPGQIDLLDFDRCNGNLSNYTRVRLANATDTVNAKLSCFSPNGFFLYSHDVTNIWQYDLQASNIYASKIKITNNPSGSYFMTLKIGLDNKIYIAPWGSSNYMHVINKPDSLGLACNFVQNALNFGGSGHWAEGGLPNVPNFALGAVAPCGVGMEEVGTENNELNIYPNPCEGKLSIIGYQFSVNTKVEVFDILGQLKLNPAAIPPYQGGKADFTIDVHSLAAGIYFLKTTDDKGYQQVVKFVKE